jgi:septal ring factor EnvC (AmiA/AmiB activator)
MTRANKALAVFMVSALGLWGCAQGPASNPANERIKALETKVSKLEDDYRAIAAARDQLRKKLTDTEEQRARLNQEVEQLQALLKDHDELKVQLASRTQERDGLQTQFDQFRKGLRNLLGQAEANLAKPAQPVTAASATGGKS